MRADLKSLFSMEAPSGLDVYAPADPEHFAIMVVAFIGSADDDKSDSFDVLVCSPSWFIEHFDERQRWPDWEAPGVHFGTGYVFMKRWDYRALEQSVIALCGLHEGYDWGTVANRIGRLMPWEFDYQWDRFVEKTADRRPRFPDDK
jgi:hypothetical protein